MNILRWLQFFSILLSLAHCQLRWSYSETSQFGPGSWGQLLLSSTCDSGKRQSPINIETIRARSDKNLVINSLQFSNFDKKITGTLQWSPENMVRFFIDTDPNVISVSDEIRKRDHLPRIWGGSLGRNGYILHRVEIHVEAEHRIDSYCNPMEIQFYTYNARYSSYAAARQFPDGIAAVAIFVDESSSDETRYYEKADISEITSNIQRLAIAPGMTLKQVTAALNLSKIIPKIMDRTVYFQYEGSMTSPPCTENVLWLVFPRSVRVSKEDMSSIYDYSQCTDGTDYFDSFRFSVAETARRVQPANGRAIRTNGLRRHPSLPLPPGTRPFSCLGTFLCVPY